MVQKEDHPNRMVFLKVRIFPISACRNHRFLISFLNPRLFFVFFLKLRRICWFFSRKPRTKHHASKIAKARCFLPASCGKLPRAFHGLPEVRFSTALLFCFRGTLFCSFQTLVLSQPRVMTFDISQVTFLLFQRSSVLRYLPSIYEHCFLLQSFCTNNKISRLAQSNGTHFSIAADDLCRNQRCRPNRSFLRNSK